MVEIRTLPGIRQWVNLEFVCRANSFSWRIIGSMFSRRTRGICWATHKKVRGWAVIAAITGPLTRWLIYRLRLISGRDVLFSLLYSVVAFVLLYVGTFTYYWIQSMRGNLPDPTREISPAQKRKIANYLKPYGRRSGKPERIVELYYHPGVKDAASFGEAIKNVLEDKEHGAGWMVDIMDTYANSEPSKHKSGIWLYGEGCQSGNPPTADLLQDAFRLAGYHIHVDPESFGMHGTCMVIGFWE